MASLETNRLLLRARDAMDRDFAQPLDIGRLARVACLSESSFIRSFKAVFGETPHRYLQRRRIERAMYLLRTTETSITDVCMAVGWASLGSFSRTFSEIVGESPTEFRDRGRQAAAASGVSAPVPSCFVKAWTRPSSFGEATVAARS